eukprot:2710230-Amphidinium_carterae.1
MIGPQLGFKGYPVKRSSCSRRIARRMRVTSSLVRSSGAVANARLKKGRSELHSKKTDFQTKN